jgi:maleate isomerase
MTRINNIKDFEQFQTKLDFKKNKKCSRIHIGLVQLSTDHTLEADWAKLMNHQAVFFSSRVFYSSHMTAKALEEISNGITAASDLIAQGLSMDVMAFGCTSASIIIGEESIADKLVKNRGDIPATNPWTAAKAAFSYLGAKNITVFSPYPTEVNFSLYQQLIQAGYEISTFGSLGIAKDTDITKVSKLSMIQALTKLLSRKEITTDVIFMPCTNLRLLDYIEEIEALFGIPVVTSNSAMFWHCLHLVGAQAECPGYGVLLNKNKREVAI